MNGLLKKKVSEMTKYNEGYLFLVFKLRSYVNRNMSVILTQSSGAERKSPGSGPGRLSSKSASPMRCIKRDSDRSVDAVRSGVMR